MDLFRPAFADVGAWFPVRPPGRHIRTSASLASMQRTVRLFTVYDEPEHKLLPDILGSRAWVWAWGGRDLHYLLSLRWTLVCETPGSCYRHRYFGK
jgi:hypothetical protein